MENAEKTDAGRHYAVSPGALRSARRNLILTQEALAEESGVHVATIGQIEGGGRPRIRAGTLRALAEALGVEPEQLLLGSGEEDGDGRRA